MSMATDLVYLGGKHYMIASCASYHMSDETAAAATSKLDETAHKNDHSLTTDAVSIRKACQAVNETAVAVQI